MNTNVQLFFYTILCYSNNYVMQMGSTRQKKHFFFTMYRNGINRNVVTLCTFVYLFVQVQFVDLKMPLRTCQPSNIACSHIECDALVEAINQKLFREVRAGIAQSV
jgi:hypothetical protein